MSKSILFILTVVVYSFCIPIYGQSLDWVKSTNGFENGNAADQVTLDPQGNIISAGHFEGLVTFEDVGNEVSFGNSLDIVIQKLSPSGDPIWIKIYNGTGSEEVNSVATDSNGNVYVLGKFFSTMNFDGVVTLTSSATVNFNYFLLKLDSAGNTIWGRTVPGLSAEKGNLSVDANDDLYVLSPFSSTEDFDGTSLSASNGSLYLAKIDVNTSDYIFIRQFGSNGSSSRAAFTIDANNNLLITGSFINTGFFGSTTLMTPTSAANGFITKLSSTGNFLWTKHIQGQAFGTSIVTDSSNDVYLTGSYVGEVQFDDEVLNVSTTGVFLEKLNSSGTKEWLKGIEMNTTNNSFFRRGVLTIDETDQLYHMFPFKGVFDFEGTTYTHVGSSTSTQDILLTSFNGENSNVRWAKQYNKIAFDKDGAIIARNNAIYLSAGVATNQFDGVTIPFGNPTEILIAKINDTTLSLDSESIQALVKVYYDTDQRKATVSFSQIQQDVLVQMYNVNGALLLEKREKDRKHLAYNLNVNTGIYFMKVTTSNGVQTTKFIVD